MCGGQSICFVGAASPARPRLAFAAHQVFPQFLSRPFTPALGLRLGVQRGNPLGFCQALGLGCIGLVCHGGVIAQMWINRKIGMVLLFYSPNNVLPLARLAILWQ